jgi:hypothetical protein
MTKRLTIILGSLAFISAIGTTYSLVQRYRKTVESSDQQLTGLQSNYIPSKIASHNSGESKPSQARSRESSNQYKIQLLNPVFRPPLRLDR